MKYIVDGLAFQMSYQQLKALHDDFCKYSDEVFLSKLVDALHLACIICYLKERNHEVLGDKGIIHELVHLLSGHADALRNLAEIRKQYKEDLYLAN
jgi:hypothetical protein